MGYVRGAVLVVLVAILALGAGTILYQRAELAELEGANALAAAQLADALKTNQQQSAVIVRLTEQRELDNRMVSLLNTKLDAIRNDAAATAASLEELKATDPDAKSFLSTAVPDSVRRLLANPRQSNPRP